MDGVLEIGGTASELFLEILDSSPSEKKEDDMQSLPRLCFPLVASVFLLLKRD